jgi:hypothetical protein
MGKIQEPKRIRIEDFKSEEKELIGKISDMVTPFMDDVFNVLDGRLDFENLNRQIVDLELLIDAAGKVVNSPQVKTTFKTQRVRGINVINAVNLGNSSVYPTSLPMVNFTINGAIMTVLNITGLQANSRYKLTLELIG